MVPVVFTFSVSLKIPLSKMKACPGASVAIQKSLDVQLIEVMAPAGSMLVPELNFKPLYTKTNPALSTVAQKFMLEHETELSIPSGNS